MAATTSTQVNTGTKMQPVVAGAPAGLAGGVYVDAAEQGQKGAAQAMPLVGVIVQPGTADNQKVVRPETEIVETFRAKVLTAPANNGILHYRTKVL